MMMLHCILKLVQPISKCEKKAWALLGGIVIAVIDEVKKSDASTDINDSIEDVNDFF